VHFVFAFISLGYELVVFASSCKFIKFIFQCFTKDGSEVEGDFGASFGVSAVSFGEAGGLGRLGVSDLVSHFALLLHFWRNWNRVFTLFSRRREGGGSRYG